MATENANNTEPAELLVVFVVVALREFSKPASIACWRALAMRDDPRTVVTDPHASYVGTELGERALLPGADAILGEIRYSNWPGRTVSGK